MVGKPNTWWGSHTWWAAHIHGGLASQQASFGGGPGWMGARGARPLGRPRAPPWPPSNLAPQQSWPAGWPGHHICGLPTMHGFPTMYLASPPCILSKGIRYQVSRYPGIQIPDVQISRYPDIQISGSRYQVSGTRKKT